MLQLREPQMVHKHLKLAVLGIVVIFTTYFIISSLSSPTSTHKTEYNSPKLQLAKELELNSNWKELGLNFQPNKKYSLPDKSTLRQQLSYQFPYDESKPFPKKSVLMKSHSLKDI